MEEKTDSELVVLARKGDKDAFGHLALRYQNLARRFAWRLVANDDCAQELAQEAVLQAYLSLEHLHDPARFKSWLCGIALNICRSYLRDRKAIFFSLDTTPGRLQLDEIPTSDPNNNPKEIAEELELHKSVLEAVNEPTPKDRDTTLSFCYDQLSIQEIAMLQDISVGAVKVRLHRARRRLKTKLISKCPEIVTRGKRGKKMIKVTIADVVNREQTDAQGHPYPLYIVVLWDEAGRKVLPIWVGLFEGQSIATGLGEYSSPRPMTYKFFADLLKAINARVEQVRVEMLKGNTFYAVVKIRCGQTVSELDARPSDGLALALRTGSPIFVAEDVLNRAGLDMPSSASSTPVRSGVGDILREIGEQQQKQAPRYIPRSPEELTKAKEKLIADVFKE